MEIEEAQALVKQSLSPILEFEETALKDSYGKILFEDVFSPINIPPFSKSAMDGYAVSSFDVDGASKENPVELDVLEELYAGEWKEISYAKKSAVRVMTGSPLPSGYDTVVMQEDSDYGEKKVLIYKGGEPFKNCCVLGEDVKKNERLLPAGKRLGRAELALLSGAGFASVKVKRPARVSILCVGSELQEPGRSLEKGKVYSSLGSAFSCSVTQMGFLVVREKIIVDDKMRIAEEIKGAVRDSDIVITTGGVSVGKKDFLPQVLESLGAKTLFCNVNVQPGTPTRGTLLDNKFVLSLSGNPFAAFVNFDLYFYHAAASLMRSDSFELKKTCAILQSDYDKTSVRRRLLRARMENGKVFLPSKNHASSIIGNLVDCNCYIDIPAKKAIVPGDKVQVVMAGA